MCGWVLVRAETKCELATNQFKLYYMFYCARRQCFLRNTRSLCKSESQVRDTICCRAVCSKSYENRWQLKNIYIILEWLAVMCESVTKRTTLDNLFQSTPSTAEPRTKIGLTRRQQRMALGHSHHGHLSPIKSSSARRAILFHVTQLSDPVDCATHTHTFVSHRTRDWDYDNPSGV